LNSKHIRFIGGGRWATIVLSELVKNFPEVKVDWICLSNLTEKQKITDGDDIFRYTCLFDKKEINDLGTPDKIIIASHSSQHCSDLNECIDFPGEILVEKPLFSHFSDFKFLPNHKKENIHLNLEFYNAFFLEDFYNAVKSIDIKKIDITWHDPLGELRNDQEEKFSEIFSSLFMDQMLHVLSIFKSLKLDSKRYENIRISEDNLDSDSIQIQFTIKEIEASVSLSRFSHQRERKISLNDGEAELIFTTKPYMYKQNKFIREISDSGRLFPIAQTLSNFLFDKETDSDKPLSLKSLNSEIELCFKCEDIFTDQMSNLTSIEKNYLNSADKLSPLLIYFLGIMYYRYISQSPSLNNIQYLKGDRGVKELMSWGREHIDMVNGRLSQ